MSSKSVLVRFALAGLLAGSALSAAHAQRVTTLGSDNTLVTVAAQQPGTITRATPITGLGAGQTLLGLDSRPASPRVLYGTSNTGQLYAINGLTGTATAIGAPITVPAGATGVGYDFNPVPDRLRVVFSGGENLRLNPNDGTVAGTDTPVAYATTDVNALATPNIVGAAYTNAVAGATQTTLYVIDAGTGTLALQGGINGAPSPNSGVLTTVGGLGAATTGAAGFDILPDGQALATLTDPESNLTSLYSVNLNTGVATLVGRVGAGAQYTGLTFQAQAFQTFAVTPNQTEVGIALDRFVGVPSDALTRLYASLDGLAVSEQADALDQLSPRAYALLPDTAFQTSEFIDNSLRRYMRDVRAGGTGTDDPNRQQGTDRSFGFWLTGSGRFGKLSGSAARDRTDYGATGVIGGVDYRFSPTTFVGAFGGYDLGEARLNRLSPNSSIDAWFAGGYGSFGIGPFYVDVHGSYADTDYDLRRSVAFGDFAGQNRVNAGSEQWTVAGTVGLSFDFAGFELEPYGGARYVDLRIDEFSELGSASRLSIAETDIESFQSITGLRVGAQFDAGPAVVRASIRGEWRHEFENDDRIFNASFKETAIDRTFTFATDSLDEDFAVVGGGFTVSGPTSPLSFHADYSGQISGGYDIHAVQGGLRLTF